MTVSMRVMSAGDGYAYLLKTVAAGDGNRSMATPLTRYYAEKGTPPGRWLGTGVHGLGDGRLVPGDIVTEAHLQLLLGAGRDPVTGEPLGLAFPKFLTVDERIQQRIGNLDPVLSAAERAETVAMIEAEEAQRGRRRAVAGYDLTFSVPKSVSALWAVCDAPTQALIVQAHHAAIDHVVAMLEREVAATRTGTTAEAGAVAQMEVTGVIATAFDHYDSRAGDPQLHTHVVISNKVCAVHDGKWRSLDGRPMHAAVVALSEHYNGLLADHLTRALGVGWEARDRGRDRNRAWEITGVPDALISEFSSRSAEIDAETDRLIDDYVATHGRRPSTQTVIKLRSQATIATRPAKTVKSLAELCTAWRQRAASVLREDVHAWTQHAIAQPRYDGLVHAVDVDEDDDQLALTVVRAVAERRATWTHWNLYAEAARQLMHARFATDADRDELTQRIVEAAAQASLRLTPPELAASPAGYRRPDGTSVFRPKHSTLYSSTELLTAEDRLLELSRDRAAPVVQAKVVGRAGRTHDRRWPVLSDGQQTALTAITTSGRTVDVLVGAAGTGKTTAMTALRQAWEHEHGAGSVVGLAPSAAAADVLAGDLGIATENTAKWLYEHQHGRWNLRPGQLAIIDEASLAGTFALDEIASHAAQVGAKVLLVGDWAQLGAIDAGGAFGLLVRDREAAPELLDVRRFQHDWERAASTRLRSGDTNVIDVYQQNGRIVGGGHDDMLDAAYSAWHGDCAAGKSSLMIAETLDTVTALNMRARLDRILAGKVAATGHVSLDDGTEASAGDLIVTRKNDRRLVRGRGWVKNGDRWTVVATHDDGAMTVRPERRRFGASVRLPAGYVAEHVELGYATTVYRAQGSTVDTAHVLVASASMIRETFYVAMTRGRESNVAYVAIGQAQLEEHLKVPDGEITARSVLVGVMRHVGAEASAHETIRAEQDRWAGIAQLAAEYDTLAVAAQRDRWASLTRRSGLTPDEVEAVISSAAFGPLSAELRRAEADHYDVDTLLPRLVAARGFDNAVEVAAVLRERLITATRRRASIARKRKAPRLIAGLIPEATGAMAADMRVALNERKQLIERRARNLAEAAIAGQAPWTRELGNPPADRRRYRAWIRQAATVAAYRDRYQVTSHHPLGPAPEGTSQRIDTARARVALIQAQQLSRAAQIDSDTAARATRHSSIEHRL